MMNTRKIRIARAVFGAALITLVGACSDAPSSPLPRMPEPPRLNQPGLKPADVPIVAMATVELLPGERLSRRVLRRADGHEYRVEMAKTTDGLVREMAVVRDGQPVIHVVNDWQRSAGTARLLRQRLTHREGSAAPVLFDTKARGGVEAFLGYPVDVPISLRARPTTSSVAVTRWSGKLRKIEDTGDSMSGPCDAAARAVDSALEDWLLSVAAMAGATATGNLFGAVMAYGYQLKKWGDVGRAEAALDTCVENAGKKPTDEI